MNNDCTSDRCEDVDEQSSASRQEGGRSKGKWYLPGRSEGTLWKSLLVLSGLLYVADRFYHLGYLALWHDEVFSVYVARMPWPAMLRAIIEDIVHPPLFYVVLKGWMTVGGTSVTWMYLLPLLASVGVIVPLLLFCREWKLSEAETVIAFSLVSSNQLLIHYSQELRMYSLLVLFALVSLWLFSRFLHTGRGILWLTLVNLLLAYTHYYGAVFIATELVWVLVTYWRDRNHEVTWKFVQSTIIVALCFLPWVYLAWRAMTIKHGLAQNLAALERPRVRDIVWFYGSLKGQPPIRHTVALGTILFALPIAAAFISRTELRPLTKMLAMFAFFPTMVSVVASYVMSESVFSPRYLIITAIPCLLLVTIGIRGMGAWPRRTLGVAVLAWALGCGIWYTLTPNRKVPWDQLAQQLASAKVPIYAYDRHEQLPLNFYGAPTRLIRRGEISRISDPDLYFVYRPTTIGSQLQVLLKRGFLIVGKYEARDLHEEIVAVHLVHRGSAGPS